MSARILVIEDNRENLELMTYLLRAFGHTVSIALDGAEGVDAARRELPDLILCDIAMPKMDGFEVVRELRGDARLAKCQLVAVTAFAMRGDRDRILAVGFNGYISKPIVPEEFLPQVEAFLQPRAAAPTACPGSEVTCKREKSRRANIMVVDNSPVNLHLMQSTLEPFGYSVTAAASVKEALALARQQLPDLILTDLHMPEADGHELLKAAKADPGLSAVPVAMISSTVWRDADPDLALGLGAKKFILRPIEPERLVAEIEDCLRSPAGTQSAKEEGREENQHVRESSDH